jgi:hypothetical protein
MKTYGGMDVEIHVFFATALVGGEWSASRLGRFTPREIATGTHCTEGLFRPGAGMDNVERRKILTIPGFELQPLDGPARSKSL